MPCRLKITMRSGWLIVGLMPWSLCCFPAEPGAHLNSIERQSPSLVPKDLGSGFELPPLNPDSGAPALSETGELRNYNRCTFRGNTVVEAIILNEICNQYLRRPVGQSEVEELRIALTKAYVSRGYVNSGVVFSVASPDRETLAFDVVEGKLRTIRAGGLGRLNPNYVIRRLAPTEGEVLNVEVLRERYQSLLSDPLFQRMNARLVPEPQLGEAALELEVQRAQPYRLSFFTNNYRPPSIGSQAMGFNGGIRNLTGQGDALEIGVQQGRSSGGGGRTSLSWLMPLNYSGTVFSFQMDRGRSSVVEEPLAVLGIRSNLNTRDFGLSQTLVESLRHRFVIGINQIERVSKTTLLGQPFSFTAGEPDGITKAPARRVWQEYSYRTEVQAISMRSTFSFVRNNLQLVRGLPSATQADPASRIWLGQAQYVRQVMDNGAQVILRGSMQQTNQRLLPLDGIALGGVNTVRGFRENQLVRDRGRVLNLEFMFPAVRNGELGMMLDIKPFYDQGWAANTGDIPAKLSSAGVAMRFSWVGFSIDLAVARALAKPISVANNSGILQDRGVHLQITYQFL